jgi:hypothetical protein
MSTLVLVIALDQLHQGIDVLNFGAFERLFLKVLKEEFGAWPPLPV